MSSKIATCPSWKIIEAILSCPTLRTAYIWGPPGIGKTYGAQRWGLKGRNVYTVTLTEETPAAELRGHYIPKGGEFVWHDGPVTRAFREGARLILNEAAHASCDVVSFLYAALESPETSKITLPTGETVSPGPGFQCIVTDNVSPDSLPEALKDRFDVTAHVTSPSQEAIVGFPEHLQNVVLSCATSSDPMKRISLRSWEAVERLSNGGIDFETAAAAVFGVRWPELKKALSLATAAGKV